MKISSDFHELLTLLNEYEVKYLVVGGYALAAHGFPRNTKDIDIYYEASPENARRLMAALTAFGFGGVGLSESDFDHPGEIIQLGFPPNRIGLINTASGIEYQEAWENRVLFNMGDMIVPIIGKAEFIKNKKASGRLADLADIERVTGGQE